MPFDVTGRFVRSGNFQADKIDGKYAEAIRFDLEMDDIADALSRVRSVAVTPTVTFNASLYYTKTQADAKLGAKQDALGFTPIDEVEKGVPGGVVPLNATGTIDLQYLPTVYGSGTPGPSPTGVTQQQIISALGYVPFRADATLPKSQVDGLTQALAEKQDIFAITPPTIGGVAGLQIKLDEIDTKLNAAVSVSTTSVESEVTFPKGHTILVSADKTGVNYGTGSFKNALKPVYTGGSGSTANPAGYTTAPVGSVLTGQWLCRGTVGEVSIFERVA